MAGRKRLSEGTLDGVDDSLRAAVVGESERNRDLLSGIGRVGDADSLIGKEVEKLVLLDGAAECGAELVPVQEIGRQDRRSVVEERLGIHVAVLELLIDFAVQLVSAGFGEHADVRSAVGALSSVVHGGIDGNFLNGLGRRSRESLSNCPIHRRAGLDFAAGAEALTDIEYEAVFANLAGGVSVEEIVGADAVHGEAVAGVTLAVGENRLVAESGVAASATEEVGVNTRAHDRQLREAAGSERSLLNGGRIHDIAGSGVHLVHERGADDVYFGRHGSDLEICLHGGGTVSIHQHFGVAFGIEALLGEGQLIGSGRKIRNGIGTAGLRTNVGGQVGRDIARRDGDIRYGRSGCISYGARNGAKNLLGSQGHAGYQNKRQNCNG